MRYWVILKRWRHSKNCASGPLKASSGTVRRYSWICTETEIFVLNLSDIIFLRTAPHTQTAFSKKQLFFTALLILCWRLEKTNIIFIVDAFFTWIECKAGGKVLTIDCFQRSNFRVCFFAWQCGSWLFLNIQQHRLNSKLIIILNEEVLKPGP